MRAEPCARSDSYPAYIVKTTTYVVGAENLGKVRSARLALRIIPAVSVCLRTEPGLVSFRKVRGNIEGIGHEWREAS